MYGKEAISKELATDFRIGSNKQAKDSKVHQLCHEEDYDLVV